MPAATSPKISIERLERGHDRSGFSCGVDALDRYLATQASQDARRGVAATYVCVERGGKRVVGYYTLSATSIALSGLPGDIAKKLPKYPDVPAALVGRLAVDRNHHGRGLGAVLLIDALKRVVDTAERIGVFAVVVDAKDDAAIAFYEKHGFISLQDVERRLFLPMETARKLFV